MLTPSVNVIVIVIGVRASVVSGAIVNVPVVFPVAILKAPAANVTYEGIPVIVNPTGVYLSGSKK